MFAVRSWCPIYNGMDAYIGRRSSIIGYFETVEFARAVAAGAFPGWLVRYYDDAGADVIDTTTGRDVTYPVKPVAAPVLNIAEIPF